MHEDGEKGALTATCAVDSSSSSFEVAVQSISIKFLRCCKRLEANVRNIAQRRRRLKPTNLNVERRQRSNFIKALGFGHAVSYSST